VHIECSVLNMETLIPYCEVVGNRNSFVEYDLPTQETLLDNNTQSFPGLNSNHLPAQNANCNMHKFQPTVQPQHHVPTVYKSHGEALENEPPTHYVTITIAALNFFQGLCVTKAKITARGFAFI